MISNSMSPTSAKRPKVDRDTEDDTADDSGSTTSLRHDDNKYTTQYGDMTISVDGLDIPCHRVYICQESEMINDALNSGMLESVDNRFVMRHDVATRETVYQYIMCMYGPWHTETMDEHVLEIWQLAHFHRSPSVIQKAIGALPGCGKRWTVDQLLHIIQLGYMMKEIDPVLWVQCLHLIREQAIDIASHYQEKLLQLKAEDEPVYQIVDEMLGRSQHYRKGSPLFATMMPVDLARERDGGKVYELFVTLDCCAERYEDDSLKWYTMPPSTFSRQDLELAIRPDSVSVKDDVNIKFIFELEWDRNLVAGAPIWDDEHEREICVCNMWFNINLELDVRVKNAVNTWACASQSVRGKERNKKYASVSVLGVTIKSFMPSVEPDIELLEMERAPKHHRLYGTMDVGLLRHGRDQERIDGRSCCAPYKNADDDLIVAVMVEVMAEGWE